MLKLLPECLVSNQPEFGYWLSSSPLWHWGCAKTCQSLRATKNEMGSRTRWWRRRSLLRDSSGIHLQTRKSLQYTSWEWAGVPDHRKKNNAKLCKTKKAGGERGEFIGLHLPLAGGGNWSRGPIPTYGHKFRTDKKHLRLRVKQLICDSLTGMRFMQSLLQPYGQERGCRYQPAIWAGLDRSNTEAWEKGAESKGWGREGWNAL